MNQVKLRKEAKKDKHSWWMGKGKRDLATQGREGA